MIWTGSYRIQISQLDGGWYMISRLSSRLLVSKVQNQGWKNSNLTFEKELNLLVRRSLGNVELYQPCFLEMAFSWKTHDQFSNFGAKELPRPPSIV